MVIRQLLATKGTVCGCAANPHEFIFPRFLESPLAERGKSNVIVYQ